MLKLVIIVILIAIAAVFAGNNVHATEVHFILWGPVQVSTIILLVICALLGAVGMYVFSLLRQVRKYRQAKRSGSASWGVDEEF